MPDQMPTRIEAWHLARLFVDDGSITVSGCVERFDHFRADPPCADMIDRGWLSQKGPTVRSTIIQNRAWRFYEITSAGLAALSRYFAAEAEKW